MKNKPAARTTAWTVPGSAKALPSSNGPWNTPCNWSRECKPQERDAPTACAHHHQLLQPPTTNHPNHQPLSQSPDRKSTRLNSSHLVISYAVFCLKKKNIDLTI